MFCCFVVLLFCWYYPWCLASGIFSFVSLKGDRDAWARKISRDRAGLSAGFWISLVFTIVALHIMYYGNYVLDKGTYSNVWSLQWTSEGHASITVVMDACNLAATDIIRLTDEQGGHVINIDIHNYLVYIIYYINTCLPYHVLLWWSLMNLLSLCSPHSSP